MFQDFNDGFDKGDRAYIEFAFKFQNGTYVGLLLKWPHIEAFEGRGDVVGEKDIIEEGEEVCYEGVIGQGLNHFLGETTGPPCLIVLTISEAFA
jgi:hypothetical protein